MILKNYIFKNKKILVAQEKERIDWVSLIKPTEEEIKYITSKYFLPRDIIRESSNLNTASHINYITNLKQQQITEILLLCAGEGTFGKNNVTTGYPLLILLVDSTIITVTDIILPFIAPPKKLGEVNNNKEELAIHLISSVYEEFKKQLLKIESEIIGIERNIHKLQTNSAGLDRLAACQKSIVFLESALESNEKTFQYILEHCEKLFLNNAKYKDKQYQLRIQRLQTLKLAKTLTTLISQLSDMFSNIISYQLNIIMKILTELSIIITIPTIIVGLWGVNTKVPFQSSMPGFFIVSIITVIATLTCYIVLKHIKYL
ncbi:MULTISPECIES: magnesium transporter CorA family protein [Liquorilactobacillus]|nr:MULTISPECIES: magnesium transporter CorA family protein [Liquorilactobacillus]EJF01177.1 ion Mg(2+)/Co(2+) transport protein [Liquorilactobacillus mali KCTC 3596 = DSM 20444]MDC7953934.1 magnesium transporter CorA family protein [Liquorilactobacillus mali]QYH55543.1 magnesium transporter CorA family protein [Liquorilactobacillus nagelii DSM 13675]